MRVLIFAIGFVLQRETEGLDLLTASQALHLL